MGKKRKPLGEPSGKSSQKATKKSKDLDGWAITGKALMLLLAEGVCTQDKVRAELNSPGITKHLVTRRFSALDDNKKGQKEPILGITKHGENGLMLDEAYTWLRHSRMYHRKRDNPELKAQIAETVVNQMLRINKTRLIFFDAGTTALECLNKFRAKVDLHLSSVLTNNLLIAFQLLNLPDARCLLPPGRPDRATAAITETDPEDLERWFRRNPPEVSIVSFHWVELGKDYIDFCVENQSEQATKVGAIQSATDVLFVVFDSTKIRRKPRETPTVRLEKGQWYDVRGYAMGHPEERHKLPLNLRSKQIFLCSDAPAGAYPELDAIPSSAGSILRPAVPGA